MDTNEQNVTPEVTPEVTPNVAPATEQNVAPATARKSGDKIQESLIIVDRKSTNDGGVILITRPSKEFNKPKEGQKTSVFTIHPKVYEGFAKSLRVHPDILFDYLVGSTYDIDARFKVQGEVWKDERNGSTGVYKTTGFQLERSSIKLSKAGEQEIRKARLNILMSQSNQATVSTGVGSGVANNQPSGADFEM